MNWLKAFYAKYSTAAHVIAAIFMAAVGAYAKVPAFHDFVLHVYAVLPSWMREAALAVIGLVIWYKTNLSDNGVVKLSAKTEEKKNAKRASAKAGRGGNN